MSIENIEFEEFVHFDDITISYNPKDSSGSAYKSRDWYEEYRTTFHDDVNRVISPKYVIDIGGNYGVTTCFFSRRYPNAQLIMAEPNVDLKPYIQKNISQNNVRNCVLINKIIGNRVSDDEKFHINPHSSQDCRVLPARPIWREINSTMTTIDEISQNIDENFGVFIKIDTQGYEENILLGASRFLSRNKNWLIKSEFDPGLMISQGTNPHTYLKYLIENYIVAEYIPRPRYGASALKEVFRQELRLEHIEGFINHVKGLNRNERGWVDILITPERVYRMIMG